MDQKEMKARTKQYALRIVKLCRELPQTREGRLIGDQLFRAGTSVGANYRSACRARSKADFASKLGIVLEEADESLYWLEIIHDSKLMDPSRLKALMEETNEIIAILVASIKKVRGFKS